MTLPYSGKTYKTFSIRNGKVAKIDNLMAERVLGKPMPKGVEVHHLNGTKQGPVVICQDHAYHFLLHVRARALQETGHANWRKCGFCKKWDDLSKLQKHGRCWRHRECHNASMRKTC